MNWLRDNILKVVGIVFAVIIIIVVIVACSSMGSKPITKLEEYQVLENKLQNAAINYVKDHKSILPKNVNTVRKLKLETLIENGNINELVASEDSSINCKGYVEIEKLDEEKADYRYTPYLSCGKYYTTKIIADYIIDKETEDGTFERTADDGLYSSGEEYIFRGEYPNNYVVLGERLYRIIKITNNKELQLISTEPTENSYVWDDRYNIEKDSDYGVNDFKKSRMLDTLNYVYSNKVKDTFGEVFLSDTERDYIIKHDFCVGRRKKGDKAINSTSECSETMPLHVGLITVSDYARVSLDSNCKGVSDKSCSNYNYFKRLNGTPSYNVLDTITSVDDNTYEFYFVFGDIVDTSYAKFSTRIYPVVFINRKSIYKSGDGSLENPYVIR